MNPLKSQVIANKRTINGWKKKRYSNIQKVPYDHKFKYLGVTVDYNNTRMLKVVRGKVVNYWNTTNGMMHKLHGNIRRRVTL